MNTDTLEYPPLIFSPAPLAAPASIKQTVLAQFHAAEPELRALAARYEKVAFDTWTTKGLDAAKAARLDLRNNGRFLIERAEKRIKGEVNDLKRDMADEVARLVAIVEPVELAVDSQIKARETALAAEKAERDRIAAEKAAEAERIEREIQQRHTGRLLVIGGYLTRCQEVGMTAERIQRGIDMLAESDVSDADADRAADLANVRNRALEQMGVLHTQAVAREAEAARMELQHIENARVAAELAVERERIAAEAAAVKAQALDLQRKLDAQAKKEAAELEAQRAESERLERLAADARRQAEEDMKEAQAVPADFTEVATPEGDPVETQPVQPMFLELGDIAALMGFGLPPDFLTLTLRIKPAATDDGAPLFNPCQWGDICDALLAHINRLKEIHS